MYKKVFMLFSVLSFIILPTSYADYGTGHVFSGNFDNRDTVNGTTISVYKDSSVSIYGYSTFVDNAKTGWDNASSKLTLTSTTDDDCTECIAVFVGSDFLGPGILGHTDYFNEGLFGLGWDEVPESDVISNSSNFQRARVRIDDSHLDTAQANSTTNTMNMGHEFGHALSLGHFNNPPAHAGDHWMKTGLLSLSSPTSTDEDHLKHKWGN